MILPDLFVCDNPWFMWDNTMFLRHHNSSVTLRDFSLWHCVIHLWHDHVCVWQDMIFVWHCHVSLWHCLIVDDIAKAMCNMTKFVYDIARLLCVIIADLLMKKPGFCVAWQGLYLTWPLYLGMMLFLVFCEF